MEPRPHERGKIISPTRHVGNNSASMEPRPHERGKSDGIDDRARFQRASMEPRPHERGKAVRSLAEAIQQKLQWSHVLTNVERKENAK